MTCSLCGDVCSCVPPVRSAREPHLDSEADSGAGRCHGRETFSRPQDRADVEQRRSAAHGQNLETPRPKFVISSGEAPENLTRSHAGPQVIADASEPTDAIADRPAQADLLTEPDDTSWRAEVTARLHRYQARRRPRAPRYPSLRLKFETPPATHTTFPEKTAETLTASAVESSFVPLIANRESVAIDCVEARSESSPMVPAPETAQTPAPLPVTRRPEPTGKIIEFPRPAVYEPPVITDGLAEPIFDRPRILEAPEVVPPPPALGGILIEQNSKPEPERRLGIDMPLHPAPIEQRLAAMLIDCVLIALAVAVFGTIYYQLTKLQPPISQLLALGSGLLALFWAAYQYLLVVYSGTTPGLCAMKLQVLRFDGSIAKRSVRRWRVLCSWLSAISLGMGYFWQFLDEDGLCWHERVTRTYLASRSTNSNRK
jgi:uncharacterized RDD family membrane protein YckC